MIYTPPLKQTNDLYLPLNKPMIYTPTLINKPMIASP